jgi:hypothetical protein
MDPEQTRGDECDTSKLQASGSMQEKRTSLGWAKGLEPSTYGATVRRSAN